MGSTSNAKEPGYRCGTPRFKYTPLEPGTIRIIKLLHSRSSESNLCFTLKDRSYDAGEEYTALSYVCGEERTVADINIDGAYLGVAQNVWDFLVQHFLEPTFSTWLWIDAVCIDSQEVPERSAQVQQMWRVYANAEFVLSWLGPADEHIGRTFRALRKLEGRSSTPLRPKQIRRDREQYAADILDGISAFGVLSSLDYFGRTWVVPELMNARSIELRAGLDWIPWKTVLTCMLAIFRQEIIMLVPNFTQDTDINIGLSQLRLPTLLLSIVLQRLATSRCSKAIPERPAEVLETSTQQGFAECVYNALVTNLRTSCTYPEDKIFTLLAFPDIRLRGALDCLYADYSLTIEEVFVMGLAYFDKASRIGGPSSNFAEMVSGVTTMMIQLLRITDTDQIQEWLEHRVLDGKVVLRSGRQLDCSGVTLRRLIADPKCLKDAYRKAQAAAFREQDNDRLHCETCWKPQKAEELLNLLRSIEELCATVRVKGEEHDVELSPLWPFLGRVRHNDTPAYSDFLGLHKMSEHDARNAERRLYEP